MKNSTSLEFMRQTISITTRAQFIYDYSNIHVPSRGMSAPNKCTYTSDPWPLRKTRC